MDNSKRKAAIKPSAKLDRATLKSDFLASIVVFLVALPLCMGIAIASGVPVAAGLVTGIVGGIVVGWLAGCPLQVSGPAAGLTVIVYEIVQEHGLEMLGLVVIMGGLLQLIAGALHLGQWFRAVSPAVIKGMLAGIGFLILASQFHVMIDDKPRRNGAENLITIPSAIVKAAGIPQFTSQELRRTRADVLHEIGELHRQQLHSQQVLTELLTHAPQEQNTVAAAIKPAAAVPKDFVAAQTAINEDLARILDNLVQVELQQSAGEQSVNIRNAAAKAAEANANALAQLNSELTDSVIVRSSANVLGGGKTRLSAILHGIWLLVFVAGLAFLLRQIPTASLAAMLVYTGYKLIHVKSLAELRRYGWGEVAIYVATVMTIVLTDLLTGVLVGIGFSALKLLYTFSRLDAQLRIDADAGVAVLKLKGTATFIRLPLLAGELEKVPRGAELHVDFEHMAYIDHACLDLLMNWAKQHEATGGSLVVDWQSLHARFHAGNDRVELPRKDVTAEQAALESDRPDYFSAAER